MRDENEREEDAYRETGIDRFEDFLFWVWLATGLIGFALLFFV